MLTEKSLGYAGGAEVQQVLLAKELVSYGYDVSFVTYDHGQEDVEYMESIEIIKTYPREKIYELSLLLKIRYIWKALNEANADLYFHSSGSLGVASLFCFMKKRKFIFRIPSDMVVLRRYGKVVDKSAEWLDIKIADAVIVQSEFQRKTLMENFGVKGVLIKSAISIPQSNPEKPNPPIVLWVGRISEVKHPLLFIELAKAIPHARFEMVGGKAKEYSQLYEKIRNCTQNLSNLTFYGFVPFHEINEYFKRASIFVNTSSVEGFPDTFLQSWVHYTPVVSLNVDPDGIIQRNKLGFCSKTFKQLVSDVKNLLKEDGLRKKMGNNGRKYVEKEHTIQKTARKYINVFEEMMRK